MIEHMPVKSYFLVVHYQNIIKMALEDWFYSTYVVSSLVIL